MTPQEAVKWAGSRKRLSELLGVTRQAVHQWLKHGELPELQQYKLRDLRKPTKAQAR